MSEPRLELVESCGDGLFHDRRTFHNVETVTGSIVALRCDGVTRRVLSVPTDQMVEAATAEMAKRTGRDIFVSDIRAALTAAFNTLGIQETVK